MKKIILSICLLFTTLSLSACDLTYDSFNNDVEIMLAVYDDVTEALDNNDVNALYDLFSKNTQDEVKYLFDNCLLVLEYYHGDFLSTSNYAGLSVSKDKHYELETKEYTQSRIINTNTSIFYISIKYFAIHSLDEDYVGITSLHILEHDDTKEVQFTGPLLWIPGVSLGLDGLENEGIE